MDHKTCEGKYVNNLIEARQQNEDDFAYIITIQKKYNINVWVYTPCGEGKVELFKNYVNRWMITIKIEKMSEYYFGKC